MADYSSDLTGLYQGTTSAEFDPTVNRTQAQKDYDQKYKDRTTLDFTDLLSLMVAQFQNQTIDNTTDTSDMMNQLTQMTSMQAMTEMTAQMKEVALANVMSYSRSLLNEDVVVGVWKDVPVMNDNGTVSTVRRLEEVPGKVIGVGTYNGQQVIFLDDNKMYYLSDILAIGKLPDKETEPTDPENPDGSDDDVDNIDPDFSVDDTDKSDKVEGNPDDELTGGETEEKNEEVSGVDTDNAVG